MMSAFQRGLAAGKGENTFQPDAQITRAEFAAFAARVLGLEQNLSLIHIEMCIRDSRNGGLHKKHA